MPSKKVVNSPEVSVAGVEPSRDIMQSKRLPVLSKLREQRRRRGSISKG
jgi:hypothetical protein